MKIYTKTGDKGKTSLFDDIRVTKDDIRVESYGTIDELGSWIGLAKNYVEDKDIYNTLEFIQNKLFTVGNNLATEDLDKVEHYMTEDDINKLEKIIDYYMDQLNEPTGFIVPGSNKKSAYLHVARTVCRRAERRIISLSGIGQVDDLVIKYVNRLSDTLYAIGRYLEEEEVDVEY
ncbi:MAG TPA: cob(I)yrinic acid a,c-diamide adenosyltransferase [Tissierellaceae bacterium]|nr:cob(I)yrinic acid a,c-diamide adenosyltransferase [Tissierellaceae bacterium]